MHFPPCYHHSTERGQLTPCRESSRRSIRKMLSTTVRSGHLSSLLNRVASPEGATLGRYKDLRVSIASTRLHARPHGSLSSMLLMPSPGRSLSARMSKSGGNAAPVTG